jgi:hypothetical protein
MPSSYRTCRPWDAGAKSLGRLDRCQVFGRDRQRRDASERSGRGYLSLANDTGTDNTNIILAQRTERITLVFVASTSPTAVQSSQAARARPAAVTHASRSGFPSRVSHRRRDGQEPSRRSWPTKRQSPHAVSPWICRPPPRH